MVYEQFTGKKVPQMTGTMAEVQNSINNLALNLQQVSAFQQQILQRLTILENSANNQLINLNKGLQNLRLTHEQK
jgi:2'-5' RNA ligase